ncbi:hypothetical protein HDU96_005767 [Phlyctochytrium bullatum]|nr:hypothetical protein HDU96_005767 [Phlyctochytrium bullatum]
MEVDGPLDVGTPILRQETVQKTPKSSPLRRKNIQMSPSKSIASRADTECDGSIRNDLVGTMLSARSRLRAVPLRESTDLDVRPPSPPPVVKRKGWVAERIKYFNELARRATAAALSVPRRGGNASASVPSTPVRAVEVKPQFSIDESAMVEQQATQFDSEYIHRDQTRVKKEISSGSTLHVPTQIIEASNILDADPEANTSSDAETLERDSEFPEALAVPTEVEPIGKSEKEPSVDSYADIEISDEQAHEMAMKFEPFMGTTMEEAQAYYKMRAFGGPGETRPAVAPAEDLDPSVKNNWHEIPYQVQRIISQSNVPKEIRRKVAITWSLIERRHLNVFIPNYDD